MDTNLEAIVNLKIEIVVSVACLLGSLFLWRKEPHLLGHFLLISDLELAMELRD